jgi:hypothetical protein
MRARGRALLTAFITGRTLRKKKKNGTVKGSCKGALPDSRQTLGVRRMACSRRVASTLSPGPSAGGVWGVVGASRGLRCAVRAPVRRKKRAHVRSLEIYSNGESALGDIVILA